MLKVLLVGSAGFVGSNVSNYYIQHSNYKLAGYDSLYSHDLRNLQPSIQSKSRFNFYLAREEDDYIRQKTLDIERPDVIIYNMFQHNYRGLKENPGDVSCMSLLLKWIADANNFGCKKFFVIGSPDLLYSEPTSNQVEYANMCENIAHDPVLDKMSTYFILFSDLYGPRQGQDARVANILVSALKGEELSNLSDVMIDRMYIKDLFYALEKMVQGSFASGTYVFRGTEATSEEAIYRYVSGLVSGEDAALHVSLRKDPSVCPWMQTDPIYLSWEPSYKLERAIEHTFCWYDANRWAWRD